MILSTNALCLAAESSIDLHLHTTYSDGAWELDQLLDYLVGEQFRLAAIADHDRVDTIATVQGLACDKNLPVLVAVEMTTTWKGEMTDLLCYGFDPGQNDLAALAQDLFHRQQENTREVYENLVQQGYSLPPEALATVLEKPSSQQPHAMVDLLKEHGIGLGEPSAGKILWEAGCNFAASDPAAVVEAAHKSGGVCLLAHPGREDGFMTFDVQALDEFRREVSINGLEVYYPMHTPTQTEMYLDYAQRHQLLISAGSDSHSLDRHPIKYRAEMSRGLLERVGVRIE